MIIRTVLSNKIGDAMAHYKKDRREKTFGVPLTDQEYRAIKKIAAQHGIPMCEWIRNQLPLNCLPLDWKNTIVTKS